MDNWVCDKCEKVQSVIFQQDILFSLFLSVLVQGGSKMADY